MKIMREKPGDINAAHAERYVGKQGIIGLDEWMTKYYKQKSDEIDLWEVNSEF